LGCGLDSSGSGYGLVTGSCEHGNKYLDSIKCGVFLEKLSVLLASQEGLCSMELVSLFYIISTKEMKENTEVQSFELFFILIRNMKEFYF
jgi:hypothetical protein